ncbi:hypothetical protein B6D08_11075 [Gilliamella apicola]|uniref:Uncharacterized protein n=4 Tax=Gilliamella apicola TaxID=1196095 RepID=A0A242NFR2_9GAMM|nr:hypothetical protein [Gilliamella apicola]OTP81004.1 hypothetical protein B5S40_13700 [Gilliamella apicola]OTP98436.1 hypothetical protein B6D08_11075 [Gilliamella apicola]OTQ11594.1 hypothetical protein B6C91_01780 [Gilliamella apicola]
MNDLLVEYVKKLPFAIETIIILLFFILSIFTKAIIPITSFFSEKVFNKYKNSLLQVLSSTKLDKDLILESEKELSIILKIEFTQCRDRQQALYFYELSNESKHVFPYNKFKRLYRYLKFEGNDILINEKKIKYANYENWFLSLVIFIEFLLFGALSILDIIINSKEFSFNYFSYMLVMLILIIPSAIFKNLIIKKSEINQFNQIKNIYHKKIIARLTKQYKDMYFSELN